MKKAEPLTVNEECAAVVNEDLGALVDGLPAALLPRGRRLVKQNTRARDLRRGAHACDIEVLRGLVRRVCPSGPDKVAIPDERQRGRQRGRKYAYSLLGSFWYCNA